MLTNNNNAGGFDQNQVTTQNRLLLHSAAVGQVVQLDDGYQYTMVRKVGAGGQGSVFVLRGVHNHKLLAYKRIEITLSNPQQGASLTETKMVKLANNEINLTKWKNIQHKNICKIFGGYIEMDNNDKKQKIIGAVFMQHYEGQNLSDEHQWSEQRCKKLLHSMLKALSVLHSKNIVHRDVKPANIILQTDGRYILVDLGACRSLDQSLAPQTRFGTAGFIAPEMMLGRRYDETIDLWSLGITILRLAVPTEYNLKEYTAMNQEHINTEVDAVFLKFSGEFKNIMKTLLAVDPTIRQSATELLQKQYFSKDFGFAKAIKKLNIKIDSLRLQIDGANPPNAALPNIADPVEPTIEFLIFRKHSLRSEPRKLVFTPTDNGYAVEMHVVQGSTYVHMAHYRFEAAALNWDGVKGTLITEESSKGVQKIKTRDFILQNPSLSNITSMYRMQQALSKVTLH